eukprot:scaffold290_cov364-Prasinococcus_capsulatus_cf.AAC.7
MHREGTPPMNGCRQAAKTPTQRRRSARRTPGGHGGAAHPAGCLPALVTQKLLHDPGHLVESVALPLRQALLLEIGAEGGDVRYDRVLQLRLGGALVDVVECSQSLPARIAACLIRAGQGWRTEEAAPRPRVQTLWRPARDGAAEDQATTSESAHDRAADCQLS